MTRKRRRKLGQALFMSAAILLIAVSIIQVISLAKGYLAMFDVNGNVAAETIAILTPKYPYTSCIGGNPTEFEGEFVPEEIKIDTVGIDLPIVSVPLVNGTWRVNAGVANYAEGTSLVNGKTGNVGLYAHDRKNAFTEIKKLQNGDTLYLYGSDNKMLSATYSVIYAGVAEAEAVEIFDKTTDPILTLVTCDGTFSQQRYVVRAKLVGIEQLNCNEETN